MEEEVIMKPEKNGTGIKYNFTISLHFLPSNSAYVAPSLRFN